MLQHQITQSPARLGLTSPNSPSLSNSKIPTTPQSHPHHQPSQQTPQPSQQPPLTATSTSSSLLLPLLPPLPRAQTLLLQMANLASKLFEVSPNRSIWVSSFRGNLPSFLGSQIQSQSLPPLESPVTNTKEIIAQFSMLQRQLIETIGELQEVLDLKDGKEKVGREIRSMDSGLVGFSKKLREAERVLDMLVDDYSDYRRLKRSKIGEEEDEGVSNSTINTRLKLSDILSYAHRISYTTFAPPDFGAGVAPLRGALPPAPQDEQMRASQLYVFADLDIGLPKTVETKEKIIEPIIEPVPPQGLDNQLAGILPPNIEVPSGWKPGMPVELPTDIPMMPPGWKPGDPIPLPPLDALSSPKAQEQQARPMPPQGLHRPPEPIQVAPVQLDILDQDDDSSEYSSSEASSEDDD